jgi:hypothetical protein
MVQAYRRAKWAIACPVIYIKLHTAAPGLGAKEARHVF